MARELSPAEEVAYSRYLGFGTPDEVAKILAENASLKSENADRRQKLKDAEAELAKAKPPEGAVLLAGDDAKKHAAFVALGMEPDALCKLKEERDTLAAKDATRTRQDAFASAVRALKWPEDTVATLLDMNSLNGATVEMKTEKVTGKDGKQVDEQVPYVTLAGEGQKQQKFAEFAAAAPQLKGIRTESGGTAFGGDGRSAPEQRGHPGGATVKTDEDFRKATAGTASYDTF